MRVEEMAAMPDPNACPTTSAASSRPCDSAAATARANASAVGLSTRLYE
jgi:hypothetical protein